MTETSVMDVLHEAIQDKGEALAKPGSLLTGFILICEWADPERDERSMTAHTSESLTPWTATGMLQQTLDSDWGDL